MSGIDAFTVLCLHCDGVIASTTFTDGSLEATAITVGGGAVVDTAQSKFGGASLLIGVDGNFIAVTGTDSNFTYGTGDFVIDFWVRFSDNTGVQILYDGRDAGSEVTPAIYANNGVLFYFVNGNNEITGTTTVAINTWMHVAVVKSSSQTKLFLNGVQEGSTYADTNNYITNANRPMFGLSGDNGLSALKGWLDEIRVSKGTNRSWFGGFTPPTAAYSYDTALTVTFDSTDVNGVDSYTVASIYNGPAVSVLRILIPTAPDTSQPHRFLYLMPVKPGLDDTFGDGLEEARVQDLHNTYNCTLIAPSFGEEPWMGNHPASTHIQYESFMVDHLRPWAVANLDQTGLEEHWLCSFSKGGFSVLSLIMRNPGSFNLAAGWDDIMDDSITADFTHPDQGSEAVYGTLANFADFKVIANAEDRKTPFLAATRLWISGDASAYEADVALLHDEFDDQLILHEYETGETRAHLWTSGWLPEALARLADMTTATVATGSTASGGGKGNRWFRYPNIVDDGQAWVRLKQPKKVEDEEDEEIEQPKKPKVEGPSSLSDLVKAGLLARRLAR